MKAEVVAAPSWEGGEWGGGREGESGDGNEGGLMLRVEGVERVVDVDANREGKGIEEGEGLEALRERWERGMEGLRRVVERGGGFVGVGVGGEGEGEGEGR